MIENACNKFGDICGKDDRLRRRRSARARGGDGSITENFNRTMAGKADEGHRGMDTDARRYRGFVFGGKGIAQASKGCDNSQPRADGTFCSILLRN